MSDATRKTSVQGLFYPRECAKVKTYFREFNHTFDTMNIPSDIKSIVPRAIIVPHAGYIYSGFTANFAYRFLKQAKVKRIIVIGPSHHHPFKGVSGSYYETYDTPCGQIEIDSAYLFALAKKFNIGFEPKTHEKEHSTEVQFPFIQHYFPKTKVIELIYGDIPAKSLANLISALLNNKDNTVVISSDLSHFHNLKEAKVLDKNCLKGVEKLDLTELEKGCKACGLTGIQAMILAAKHLKYSSKLLDYRTSANVSHDTNSVVGYMSAMFY
ncbi:MAG: AmmeMemoRadiSam system protein B [Sulfurovum sp.]|uniref:AmmeMemoRadiSam system protein B n=1 Tax=Sulfurovum sp. TaxID=1969726 RepID=UPI002868089A|nr:AmmeMemoRadiSam system protein B [Sulfurovum sp.]MCO4845407.1 AmmeMemoRadiSam system protein B [Sulfurovum sp.]